MDQMYNFCCLGTAAYTKKNYAKVCVVSMEGQHYQISGTTQ